MGDDLVVRIDVVGHASRRWRGAKTPAEAEQLNQQLSEARAQNIRKVVEAIVKKELPSSGNGS
jgi:outer membrane protein OmpA-like peptidoglycan-associated protein